MATTEVSLQPVTAQEATRTIWTRGALVCGALTVPAIAIHGYHPFAEDGGVYLAGVKRSLDPQLYPYFSDFVTAHLKFSLFAPLVAGIAKGTHLGLVVVLFALYAGTSWLTLYSGWMLASRFTQQAHERLGAVMLLACTLTIPVAGTSLMLMDPYVTARSISTPCGILMLVAVLDVQMAFAETRAILWNKVGLFALTFAVGAAMHPLMAAYSLGCAVLLVCVSLNGMRMKVVVTCLVCALAVAMAGCLQWLSPAAPAEYAAVAQSRTYWFLQNWHWYELVGLVGPPLVIGILWLRAKDSVNRAAPNLAGMIIAASIAAVAMAALFAKIGARSYDVARLQPLRTYQTIYLIMLLALGAALARYVLGRSVARWAALFVLVGGGMTFVQRETFPSTTHVELPWAAPANPWSQAFAWIRANTPRDAVFAMDWRYITAPKEDSQNFRAIAERSALPDYAKDGGVASIAPRLTAQWVAGERAQRDLNRAVGPDQIARLRAYGAEWVVILRDTPTELKCAYANAAVKVCQLP